MRNGNIGMSDSGRNCELRNGLQNNHHGMVWAMAFAACDGSGTAPLSLAKIDAPQHLADLPGSSFCRKFDREFWSARKHTKPELAALQFNPNRQARTS
jgi:hypothetical protein